MGCDDKLENLENFLCLPVYMWAFKKDLLNLLCWPRNAAWFDFSMILLTGNSLKNSCSLDVKTGNTHSRKKLCLFFKMMALLQRCKYLYQLITSQTCEISKRNPNSWRRTLSSSCLKILHLKKSCVLGKAMMPQQEGKVMDDLCLNSFVSRKGHFYS